MGRSLTNAMVNLGVDSEMEEALYEVRIMAAPQWPWFMGLVVMHDLHELTEYSSECIHACHQTQRICFIDNCFVKPLLTHYRSLSLILLGG